jgi:lipopolysaccharide/colanic/teichoic acid biosynthesis glycosyltransferase
MSSAGDKIHGGEVTIDAMARTPAVRYETVRSFLDGSLAIVLLILLSPLILLSLVLVRLTSRGPAIYTQVRLGLDGKPFKILKIRSMYSDAEVNGPRWSLPGDHRITPIGCFLRWSHFDELPQLLNVLRGEMSLIGPRPERPEIAGQLECALPRYRERLAVRPGLTGLAQVLQAPDTDLSSVGRKLNYDLYYINRRSLWLDFRICIATGLLFLSMPSWVIASLMGFPDQLLLASAEPAMS